MKRSVFMLIAAIAAFLFGIMIFMSPGAMMEQVGVTSTPAINLIMQTTALTIIIFGIMLVFSRGDQGSPALRMILLGNLLMHLANLGVDWYGAMNGVYKISGLIAGSLVHVLLGVGFAYYLFTLSRRDATKN